MSDLSKTGSAVRRGGWRLFLLLAVLAAIAFLTIRQALFQERRLSGYTPVAPSVAPALMERLSPFQRKVVNDLQRQVAAGIRYKDGYYQGGEPPADVGVCTDVIIRSYRAAGVDLRQEVARDIRARMRDYHITKPDPNIDQRRCRNLVVFFQRRARSLPTSGPNADWQPGDIVFWDTANSGKTDHVGMIGCGQDQNGDPTIVHHWPGLPVSETNGLYRFTIRYHFRWRDG